MAGYFTDKKKKLHKFAGGDNSTKYCLPVGTIFPSAIPLTDASVHLLDGSTISQTGVYQEFAELVKALVSAGYNISCSQSDFDSAVSSTGNCGKFVIDDTLNVIRLPKITRFIQGLSNMIDIGKSVNAGLPNITGNFYTYNYDSATTSGTFKQTIMADNGNSVGTSSTQYVSVELDASKGEIKTDGTRQNDVYGKSDTVQPQATSFPYYIVLASGFTNYANLDIAKLINSKLSLAGGTMSGALKIEGITNKEKAISVESPDSDAMASFTRTDVGNSIGVGIGGDGTARGIWDEALQKWLIMHDGSALKLNGSATRPKYNSNDLALYSDVTNLGRFVNVASTSGTRYYPLVRFNKAISDGNNYSAVFLNGRIGGWGADASAYINAIFWGRDKRGGEYTFIGNINSALSRADFVMYEESSTSVVLYFKINGYSVNRLSFSGSGEGVTNLYDGSYSSSTPTGTLIASMSGNTIKAKAGQSVVLYDKSSSSSSINWSKTAGIQGTVSVSGKDFSKYSKLIVHMQFANTVTGTGILDLTQKSPSPGTYRGKLAFGSEADTDVYTCFVTVSSDKTTITNTQMGFFKGTTWYARNSNSQYFIYKIEGVF